MLCLNKIIPRNLWGKVTCHFRVLKILIQILDCKGFVFRKQKYWFKCDGPLRLCVYEKECARENTCVQNFVGSKSTSFVTSYKLILFFSVCRGEIQAVSLICTLCFGQNFASSFEKFSFSLYDINIYIYISLYFTMVRLYLVYREINLVE